VRSRAQLDAVFEYMRPDERYGLLADEHAEETKRAIAGGAGDLTLTSPYTTPTLRLLRPG